MKETQQGNVLVTTIIANKMCNVCERAFAVVVKCLSSASQVPGSIPRGNEFLDWVKKISSPLHMPKHRLRLGLAVVTVCNAGPAITWDYVALL
jgi:hypothetical protein